MRPGEHSGAAANGAANHRDPPDQTMLAAAEEFLVAASHDELDIETLTLLAGVRWLRGDLAGLAGLAPAMTNENAADTRFHYFAAVCRLAANDFSGAVESGARAADATLSKTNQAEAHLSVDWPVEAAYISGLAHLALGDRAAAAQALRQVAGSSTSPSLSQARALLGTIAFMENDYETAAKWWQTLESKCRASWKLGETLAQTVFLTALEQYQRGDYQEAAERLRSAGKLGCRDRRLGGILVAALFKAGQALIYGKALTSLSGTALLSRPPEATAQESRPTSIDA